MPVQGQATQFTLLDSLKLRRKPKPAQYMPCVSYIAGVGALDFEFIAHLSDPKKFSESLPTISGHDVIANAWNGIDAACNIKMAWDLWHDKDNYYPCKDLLIGLNLMSGLNLLTLTDSFHNGPFFGVAKMGAGSFMAAPAFAFAMFCDLVVAGIEWYYSTEEGYLKKMIGEMEFLADKIRKMENDDTLAYQQKDHVLEGLKKRQEELITNIKEQMNYYDREITQERKSEEFSKFINEQHKRINSIIAQEGNETTRSYYDAYVPNNDDVIHNRIELGRLRLHQANSCKLAVRITSFGGMLLQAMPHILLLAGVTAVVPFLNMAMLAVSLITISVVASIYLYQLMTMSSEGGPTISPSVAPNSPYSPTVYSPTEEEPESPTEEHEKHNYFLIPCCSR